MAFINKTLMLSAPSPERLSTKKQTAAIQPFSGDFTTRSLGIAPGGTTAE
jgi:hypothetical protein